MTRIVPVIAFLALFAACDARAGDHSEAEASGAIAARPNGDEEQPGDTAPGESASIDSTALALEGEGLRVFLPSGSARPIPFGMPEADARAALDRVQGRSPSDHGHNADCNAEYATWNDGLTVWFANGRFVGWSLRSDSRLTSASGIGLGSTRAQIEEAYDAAIDTTSLGIEFTAGAMAGTLESSAGDARVTNLWAGAVCIAR